jgi:hypothetical protein
VPIRPLRATVCGQGLEQDVFHLSWVSSWLSGALLRRPVEPLGSGVPGVLNLSRTAHRLLERTSTDPGSYDEPLHEHLAHPTLATLACPGCSRQAWRSPGRLRPGPALHLNLATARRRPRLLSECNAVKLADAAVENTASRRSSASRTQADPPGRPTGPRRPPRRSAGHGRARSSSSVNGGRNLTRVSLQPPSTPHAGKSAAAVRRVQPGPVQGCRRPVAQSALLAGQPGADVEGGPERVGD